MMNTNELFLNANKLPEKLSKKEVYELLEKIKNLNDTQVKQISGYIDAVEQDWKNMRSSESFRKRNNKN